MSMKNAIINPTTESGKLIVSELAKIGKKYTENDCIALAYVEGEEYGSISYNFSGTNIKIKLSDVDFEELQLDGFKIWATWEAK